MHATNLQAALQLTDRPIGAYHIGADREMLQATIGLVGARLHAVDRDAYPIQQQRTTLHHHCLSVSAGMHPQQ
jgi:hypothetical protein